MVVVPLSGEVTEAQFLFLRRILKKSEAAGASALIIDMDTYGGSLKAAVEMLGALMKSTIPTLDLCQHQCRVSGRTDCALDQASLHGASQCDRRGRPD